MSSSSAPPYLTDPSIELFSKDVDVPAVLLDDTLHVAPPIIVYPVESSSTDPAPPVSHPVHLPSDLPVCRFTWASYKEETHLTAFLASWLCKFVLPVGGCDVIKVFKVASMMAHGEYFNMHFGLDSTSTPLMTKYAGEQMDKLLDKSDVRELFRWCNDVSMPRFAWGGGHKVLVDDGRLSSSDIEYLTSIRSVGEETHCELRRPKNTNFQCFSVNKKYSEWWSRLYGDYFSERGENDRAENSMRGKHLASPPPQVAKVWKNSFAEQSSYPRARQVTEKEIGAKSHTL
ncbi:hypothetical protein Acr_08g0012990 [Actinidia rufa]|uniref:Aminotransferase-like plant mobile domain-containing protein n=1 Tax=Actinidia rufa TaxID=165716 RepID=A0A7J0F2Q4_9ERIC|nr:hypothetical protein Acr_08g0012990 [Actinidia rufa]